MKTLAFIGAGNMAGSLIGGLIAIAIIIGATFLGGSTNNLYSGVGSVITSVGP